MVSPILEINTFTDGSFSVVDVLPPVDLDPQPEPVGTRVYPGDEYIRVISDCLNPGMDYQSRTLSDKIKLAITNAMYVPHRWYRRDDGEWRVDQFSKLSFWPEDLSGGWGHPPRQRPFSCPFALAKPGASIW